MTAPTPPLPALRILHLEGNPAEAELIRSLLEQEWPECVIVRVETREDFATALQEGARFDLILSDFSLSRFDGLSALELARRHDSGTPFIFLSGTIGEDNAVMALQRGATDYVIKDRPGRLIPAIRRALQEVREQQARRRVEEKLREQQEWFQQLAVQSSDVFWFVDPDPERVIYVSPAFERIWGQPVGALYEDPRAWERAIHPDDRPQVDAAYEDCLAGRRTGFEEEYRIIRPDGSERWILDTGTPIRDSTGRLVRLSGMAKDITERQLALKNLREQAELIDKAQDAIVVRDLEDRILFWNRSAEKIYGYTQEEALGRPAAELKLRELPPDAYPTAHRLLMETGEWAGELRLSNKAGAGLVVSARWTLVRDEAGQPEKILCIESDMTKARELEMQFLRAQRFESIGLLAGGIAHDLNNALAPILMSSELLRQRVPDAGLQRFVGMIETSARHAAGLVRQVLAFARGTESERVEVQPGHAINEVLSLLRETLPRSIAIEADVAQDVRPILTNPTEFGQVLMNLCVNARDAMPGGGRLTLQAANVVVDEALAAANPGARTGPHVVISVADTGSGIPPGMLDRIFDPFFTTKAVGKGTGLGLSTVLGIVRSHGGFLQVDSRPERGTEFRLYFSVAARDPSAAAAHKAAPHPPVGTGRRILVVDDEAAVREIAGEILTSAGFEILTAANGDEALDIFQSRAAEIHLVLMDLMMPGLQGRDMIGMLRKLNPDIRIIVMSGFAGSNPQVPEVTGRLVFLQKPMTAGDLYAAVRRLLPEKPA